jgi:hypothetical protein
MNANDNCLDMKELISAYHDAELDAEEHHRVEEHLASCSACREELATVESAVRSLKSLSPAKLSVDFADDIDAIIKRAEAGGASKVPVKEPTDISPSAPDSNVRANVVPFKRKSQKAWLAVAAAITVTLLAAAYFVNGGSGPAVVADGPENVMRSVDQADEDEIASSEDIPSLSDTDDEPSMSEAVAPEIATTGGVEVKTKSDTIRVQKENAPSSHMKDDSVIAQAPKVQHPGVSSDNRGPRTELFVDDLSDNEALLALSDSYDDGGIFDGISTDEDGLYAIKM